ncbi:hypothetical protein GK047_20950 [Paenibacillus sp. SYP-B3998]|uniref:Uncharacterized protein n=1 Tax=Paenibacillus sp. SYP-B3998 TaxID=2678564 RepID=A0A6G4A3T3_9BACL|nr:hypothetical protein [Paenibacillus sp. SYP-B3998]NEW08469.1 hypothetical protein [Paenibacillus sp. SYP-B3998]
MLWGINLALMASMIRILWVYTYFYYCSRTRKPYIAFEDSIDFVLSMHLGIGVLCAMYWVHRDRARTTKAIALSGSTIQQ